MVYARKTDGNQGAIVAALRKIGCHVLDLSKVGKGCPDLLVTLGFRIRLIEVKRPHGGRLTEQQKRLHEALRKHVLVVTTPREAIEAMTR